MICFECGTGGQLANEMGRASRFSDDQLFLIADLLKGTAPLEVIPADVLALAQVNVRYVIEGKDAAAQKIRDCIMPMLHAKCSGGAAGCGCQHGRN